MDELGCTFAALLFTKEMLESVKEDKEPNMDNAENFSPTTITVYNIVGYITINSVVVEIVKHCN